MPSAAQTAKSSKKTARKPAEAVDAIALLKADHRTVEGLFAEFEEASGKAQKAKLAQQICLELSVHATIEEELLYPICHHEIEEDLVDEAYVEHDGAKMLIAEIMAGSPDEHFYDAKVKVLSEMIKHHVKEEEQRDGLFAQAKKADIDLEEMGQRMAERKEELTKQFKDGGIPTPTTRTLNGAQVEHGQPIEG
ncbi:MAG: hemerythrin domain-containing protein [Alphaproteobacteria bacterium]|jgi:hemerythrin superfamily protein|nr:hemerythrin domain-containing protein [Alphaproteobacteria bacterium]